MTALTEADAWADALGVCRTCAADCELEPHRADCPMATGLGVARGSYVVDGECCSGPCQLPLAAGEHYVAADDGLWCLACHALAGPTAQPGTGRT